MDIINLIPSPPHIIKLAASVLNSTAIGLLQARRAIPEYTSPLSFDVHPDSGFFPTHPLPRLPKYFSTWEDALDDASDSLVLGEDFHDQTLSKQVRSEAWRAKMKSLPVLATDSIAMDLRALQRAHMVLSWLVHFFVHSLPPTMEKGPIHVPKGLAVPLVSVSRVLGIAPVLCFADTVLWNQEPINKSLPMGGDNVRSIYTFSGTEDESNFYSASARAEFKGVEALRIIDDFHSLPNHSDLASISRISRDLLRLAGIIEDISEIIQSVRATCDPHVFYWAVRQWYEGSDAKGPSGPGWVYDGIDNTHLLDLSGPSAGQSSIIHALDIFLDVDHKLQQRRFPAPSEHNKRADAGFMERMRRYMPGKHRDYLSHLSSTQRPLRDLVLRTPKLRESYNAAVVALKKLRDMHMRVACLYIVSMSRTSSGKTPGCPVSALLAQMEADREQGRGPVRGTGGNELSKLLKAGRDATMRTLLKD